MERIQHLNIEFRTEVKKERYRLNLSLSSRLRATNQNLYEVFQIRPVKQTLLFGIKKRGWCYIVEDTCKAGAFRIHLVQYVSKSQTGTTHGNCSGSYVTYFQGDEVERAGVRCNIASSLRPYSPPNPLLQYGESDQTNTNLYKLIGIVNLMLPINAVLHRFLNPCNRSLGVSVADIGPGLIIASI